MYGNAFYLYLSHGSQTASKEKEIRSIEIPKILKNQQFALYKGQNLFKVSCVLVVRLKFYSLTNTTKCQ